MKTGKGERGRAAVVIDTSNYYPFRVASIEAIDASQVESLWVVEQLAAGCKGVERNRVRFLCD